MHIIVFQLLVQSGEALLTAVCWKESLQRQTPCQDIKVIGKQTHKTRQQIGGHQSGRGRGEGKMSKGSQ